MISPKSTGILIALAAAGVLQVGAARSVGAIDCSNLPSPSDQRIVLGTEGSPVRVAAPSGYYPGCDEPGDPVSATADWGDGTTGALRVEWEGEQMVLVGEHAYETPQDETQIVIFRRNDRTGVVYRETHYFATISAAAPEVLVRDEGASIARVRTRGKRRAGELRARVHWGNGSSSARVVGEGRRFRVKAARPHGAIGRARVRVTVLDEVGGKRASDRGWLTLGR